LNVTQNIRSPEHATQNFSLELSSHLSFSFPFLFLLLHLPLLSFVFTYFFIPLPFLVFLFVFLLLISDMLQSLVQGCWKVLSKTRKETSYSDRRFWVLYILFIIRIGGILVLFVCLFLARQPPLPQWARTSSFTRFLDHTQRRTTVGRTPLDEWLARRRDLYLTTHNNQKKQTSMRPVGFEPHNLSKRAAADLRLRLSGQLGPAEEY